MIEPTSEDWSELESLVSVSRETQERLVSIVKTLTVWQRKTNLIAPNTLDAIWSRHILDSAQLVALKPNANKWLDLGSGGGFPALVVAALRCEDSDFKITLVESNHKKTAYLRRAAMEAGMGQSVNVVSDRIENAIDDVVMPEIVTARALAALGQLLDWTAPVLSGDEAATALFQKGREFRSEIEECSAQWRYDLVEHRSVLESDSRVLEISNLAAQ